MATTFPLSTYQLSDRSRFTDEQTVAQDLMSDGSMKVRVLGSSTYRTINCVFEYLDSTTFQTFMSYLRTNRVTEFDMTIAFSSPQETITGYIWSEPRVTVSEGKLYTVDFDFRGAVG